MVFGLSGKAQTTRSHKPAQFKQTCLGSLMVNGSHVPRFCALGHGNASSRTPLIIFVFGEFGASVIAEDAFSVASQHSIGLIDIK